MKLEMQLSSPELEALLADQARQPLARSMLSELLEAEQKTLAFLKLSNLVPKTRKPIKTAVFSSFTLETIQPFLAVECYLSRWACEPVFYQYSQWQAEMMQFNTADHAAFDCTVLLLDDATLTDGLADTPAELMATLTNLLSAFRASSQVFLRLVPTRPNQMTFHRGWVGVRLHGDGLSGQLCDGGIL